MGDDGVIHYCFLGQKPSFVATGMTAKDISEQTSFDKNRWPKYPNMNTLNPDDKKDFLQLHFPSEIRLVGSSAIGPVEMPLVGYVKAKDGDAVEQVGGCTHSD